MFKRLEERLKANGDGDGYFVGNKVRQVSFLWHYIKPQNYPQNYQYFFVINAKDLKVSTQTKGQPNLRKGLRSSCRNFFSNYPSVSQTFTSVQQRQLHSSPTRPTALVKSLVSPATLSYRLDHFWKHLIIFSNKVLRSP